MKRKTSRKPRPRKFGMSKALAIKTAKGIAKTRKRPCTVIKLKGKRFAAVVG